MSPRRRARFEGVLFADDFSAYANGPLAWRGRWTPNEEGDDSLLVNGHQVTGTAVGPTGNTVPALFPLARLSGDWWMAFRMIPTAAEAVAKDAAIWIGTLNDHELFLDVSWDLATTPPGEAFVSAGVDSGITAGVNVALNMNAVHTFALVHSADGKFYIWVDGVNMLEIDGVPVSLTDDGGFDLYLNGQGAANQPRATYVEVGIGVYSP